LNAFGLLFTNSGNINKYHNELNVNPGASLQYPSNKNKPFVMPNDFFLYLTLDKFYHQILFGL
jgi:hypothetical protein